MTHWLRCRQNRLSERISAGIRVLYPSLEYIIALWRKLSATSATIEWQTGSSNCLRSRLTRSLPAKRVPPRMTYCQVLDRQLVFRRNLLALQLNIYSITKKNWNVRDQRANWLVSSTLNQCSYKSLTVHIQAWSISRTAHLDSKSLAGSWQTIISWRNAFK